jgi:hypothetical protein
MVSMGAFYIYIGYQLYQLPIIMPYFSHSIFGILMIVFGILTFCASLAVWLQKAWAAKIIVVVGGASCVTLIVFGYYLMIIVVALISKATIDHIRNSRVIELSDWDDN